MWNSTICRISTSTLLMWLPLISSHIMNAIWIIWKTILCWIPAWVRLTTANHETISRCCGILKARRIFSDILAFRLSVYQEGFFFFFFFFFCNRRHTVSRTILAKLAASDIGCNNIISNEFESCYFYVKYTNIKMSIVWVWNKLAEEGAYRKLLEYASQLFCWISTICCRLRERFSSNKKPDFEAFLCYLNMILEIVLPQY